MYAWKVLILTMSIVVAACNRRPAQPHIATRLTREAFISVVVEIERARPDARAQILKKHRATESDLQEFVRKYSTQPLMLSETFDTIQARVTSANFPPDPPPRSRAR